MHLKGEINIYSTHELVSAQYFKAENELSYSVISMAKMLSLTDFSFCLQLQTIFFSLTAREKKNSFVCQSLRARIIPSKKKHLVIISCEEWDTTRVRTKPSKNRVKSMTDWVSTYSDGRQDTPPALNWHYWRPDISGTVINRRSDTIIAL